MSNFEFLKSQWPQLYVEARRAEQSAISDPRNSCFRARRCLELAVTWLYEIESSLKRPYRSDLNARLSEPTFQQMLGSKLVPKTTIIRKLGNEAVHGTQRVSEDTAIGVLRELFHFSYWLARNYSSTSGSVPDPNVRFDAAFVPKSASAEVRKQRQAQLQEQYKKFQEQDALLEKERQERAESDAAYKAEIQQLKQQIADQQDLARNTPDAHDYDKQGEETTRLNLIDPDLAKAGWNLSNERDREYPITGMPIGHNNKTGTGYVDYVLWGKNGKPLALVEAKRTNRDPQVGQQQALLYANCLEAEFGQRPLIFYTNGNEIWLWDDLISAPRPVHGFYTEDELERQILRRTTRQPLSAQTVNTDVAGRPYQEQAIRAVAERFETEKQRQALLVMATGSGKTRTVIALVDLLAKAGWIKRVLFLADRTALVNQAANAFKKHLPDFTTVNLLTDKDKQADGRVIISTYQTMMGLIDKTTNGKRVFGPGHFDLVVIDEAHRSVYQKFGAIFSYFDSLLVGLTATPIDEIDRNTFGLFNVEPGVPTFGYELDRAVDEEYLVPPRAVTVPLRFQREGISYDGLSDEEKEQWDELEWDDDGPPDAIDSNAVNTWLFNKDTVDKVLETLMIHGRKVAGGDRLGKTIIFAKNQRHANFVAERFNANYPEYNGTFARVVTHATEYAQSLIDDFSTADKDPQIAISVDMLDTGVDVPEVVNLVLFKVVRSPSKFWQMLGRGTRLCPDLYGPGDDKKDFFVFDCCENFEYFNTQRPKNAGTLTAPLGQRIFTARLALIDALDKRNDNHWTFDGDGTESELGLRRETADMLHKLVVGMNTDNFLVRPYRGTVMRYVKRESWDKLDGEQLQKISNDLAGLPSSAADNNEFAKRFDLLMLRLQLSQLQPNVAEQEMRETVRQIAEALIEQLNVPVVAAHELLLRQVADDDWLDSVSLPMLERMRRNLRGLVHLIPARKRTVVYTDFEDEIGPIKEIEIEGAPTGYDIVRFTEKARVYLREHENHLALARLRTNRPLTSQDLDELERMLIEAGVGSQDVVLAAARKAHGVGLLIRGLVGLDRAAAQEAISSFTDGKTFNSNQLDFVNLIVDQLTSNGVMNIGQLYESPFRELATSGPESLFELDELKTLRDALEEVTQRAVA